MKKYVFSHFLNLHFSIGVFILGLACSPVFAQEKTHKIANGETLSGIARKYNTTVSELQKLNPETKKGLKAGAEIILPGNSASEIKKSKAPDSESISDREGKKHEVKSGESLFKISKKYNVSVKDLETWNGIKNSDLKAGQEIFISQPVYGRAQAEVEKPIEKPEIPQAISLEKKEIHVVAKGQTLSTIARLYGTSVSDLKKLNQLKSDKVNLGQELRVPVQKPEAEIAKPEPKKEIREEIEKPMVAEVKPKPSPEIVKEKAQEILKNEPVAENPIPEKEEIKMTNGIREVNNALGYTRVVETGFAEAIEGEGNSKKHLCLHKTAPIGSILQVKNETNGQSVFVKVIGKLPETGSNEKLVIRISRQAYDRLLAVGKRFPVEVSYPQAQP